MNNIKLNLIVFLFIFLVSLTSISYSNNNYFPSLSQLKNPNTSGGGPMHAIVMGKVLRIARMPFYEQRPLRQFFAHSWDFYRFVANIKVFNVLKCYTNFHAYPIKGKQLEAVPILVEG